MIIRILGEGQFTVEESLLEDLNRLDEEVATAAESSDQEKLTAALSALLKQVRARGTVLAADVIADSDLILPDESATVEQIRELLNESADYLGIIPDMTD